jgi:hypothetical protein
MEPTTEYLRKGAMNLIKNNPSWLDEFCEGCRQCYDDYVSENPLDCGCARHRELFDDEGVHADALEWMREDEGEDEDGGQSAIRLAEIESSMAAKPDTIASAMEGFYRLAVGIVRGDAA